MMRMVLVVAISALACATQKPKPVALAKNDVKFSTPGHAAPKGKEVCHIEKDTGSNIMERVCEWQDDADTQAAAQEAMTRMQIQGSVQQTTGR